MVVAMERLVLHFKKPASVRTLVYADATLLRSQIIAFKTLRKTGIRSSSQRYAFDNGIERIAFSHETFAWLEIVAIPAVSHVA